MEMQSREMECCLPFIGGVAWGKKKIKGKVFTENAISSTNTKLLTENLKK